MRWLIDGMNVIGTRPDGWWKDRHRAMVDLVGLLERWAAAGGEDVTVVFEQPPSPPIRSTVIVVTHALQRLLELKGPITYRFRVLSSHEADFPFLAGTSNVVDVHER